MRRCIGVWLLAMVTSHLCLLRFSLCCYLVHGCLHLKQSTHFMNLISNRQILCSTVPTLGSPSDNIQLHVLLIHILSILFVWGRGGGWVSINFSALISLVKDPTVQLVKRIDS